MAEEHNSLAGQRRSKRRRSQEPSLPKSRHERPKHDITDVNGELESSQAVAHKRTRRKGSRPNKGTGWKLSNSFGGRFIDHDLAFSLDEEYVFLSKYSTVEVYSVSTSTLAQSISIPASKDQSPEITGYALSFAQPQTLWVSTYEGRICRFDWSRGVRLGQWKVGSHIHGINVTTNGSPAGEDVLYTREQTHSTWRISAHQLFGGDHASDTVSRTLYESTKAINQVATTLDGRVIVAAVGASLVIGFSNDDLGVPLDRLEYVWREISAPEFIVSLDVRQPPTNELSSAPKSKKSRKGKGEGPVIHVAIGDAKGAVLVYENILNEVLRMETKKTSPNSSTFAPRKMHWHREAVSSVKWSHDGNYIISGGSETVLVLWQLDTGKQQYLPHLSAPIENIVVSPTGTCYGVSLSDNSTIVLSTAELSAIAHVPGIQARSLPRRPPPENPVKTLGMESSAQDIDLTDFTRVPCAISPSNPSKLLLGVAASQPTKFASGSHLGTPYLQTFDLARSRHVSRQALARTNATNVNIGPEANKISEPSVKMMAVSHDGLWLATFDTWSPSSQDLEYLALDPADLALERALRTETYLKFWSWNLTKEVWELVSRIDTPHQTISDSSHPARVLGLKADPARVGFATIGEDGAARFWRPKRRYRDDLPVQGEDAKDLVTWSCQKVVEFAKFDSTTVATITASDAEESYHAACLAYSPDGSTLAVSQHGVSGNDLAIVHLVDSVTGEIRHSRSGLCKGSPIAIGFVEKHLVVLSEYLIVWNVVDDFIVYGFALSLNKSSPLPNERSATTHLAINTASNTFSISLPIINRGNRSTLTQRTLRKAQSHVIVFDPASPKPLHSLLSAELVTALVSNPETKGYVILDAAAEIRQLSPVRTFNLSRSLEKQARGAYGTISTVLEVGGVDTSRDLTEQEKYPVDEEDEGPRVIRQQQLTEVFDVGPSYALPPVVDLFEQVVGLCSRRPPSP
ncbi:MAG: hypothetical protein M4579_004456 [Chaenotheca gracillima]|nr:MAG: hypothetical protein M4579_004456 [Chaenotheca gracillima]